MSGLWIFVAGMIAPAAAIGLFMILWALLGAVQSLLVNGLSLLAPDSDRGRRAILGAMMYDANRCFMLRTKRSAIIFMWDRRAIPAGGMSPAERILDEAHIVRGID